jgi:hypothetical protein
MTRQAPVKDTDPVRQSANPFSSSSLLPMLIGGLVLTLIGMIAAVVLS